MKNYIILITIVLYSLTTLRAQDYHLSQYDVATMYLNPALTGMYEDQKGTYRVYFDQRSQWKSLGIKPFLTTYLAYDMPLVKHSKSYGAGGDKNFGAGIYIIHNRAGLGNFNTTNIILSGAYDIMSPKSERVHYLTTGVQMGMFYRAFNQNDLTYDAQYSMAADGFDQSIESGENYNRMSVFKFDANLGIFYKYLEKGKKAHPFVGFTIQHLTKPNESVIGTKSKMPMRFMFNGGCDVKINDKIDVTPRFIYWNQAKAYEFNIGFLGYYSITDNDTKLIAGFDYRLKDACVIHLGIKQESYLFRLSYDINTSYLKTFSRGRGAFEISLIYTGQKGKSFIQSISKY
jgi:type IX secretion system PorP/SprF family membrane protein